MSPYRAATITRIIGEAQQRGWLTAIQAQEISQRVHRLNDDVPLESILCPPLQIKQLSDLLSTPENNEPPPTLQIHSEPILSLNTPYEPDETETPNPFRGDSMLANWVEDEGMSPNPFRGDSTLSMIVLPHMMQTQRPQAQATVHDTWGGYELRECLGRGGMGEVFEAYDAKSGRLVALKTLRAEMARNAETRDRFWREAKISSQLEHPCVIPVYDMGDLPDGRPYYTMRIVRHRSLREVLPGTENGWNLKRCCAALVRICRGLAYAHARGVLHRDLKPENILLGDYDEVYLADWGIAKVLSSAEPEQALDGVASDYTRVNISPNFAQTLGSPGYMSPEQARGRSVDPRSDLFSVGVILYEILTGKRPFQGATQLATLILTQEHRPTPPAEINQQCPPVLEDLCLLLLEKDANARPRTADAVANTIEAFLEGSLDQERRRIAAKKLVEQARQSVLGYRHLSEVRRRHTERAQQLLKDIKPWDAPEKKQPAWELEEQAKQTSTEQVKALAEAIELYSRALGHEPQNKAARRGLAELYWERAEQAILDRDEPTRILSESMVQEYDDGHFKGLLTSEATVSLRSNPTGAEVYAYSIKEVNRVETLTEKNFLGKTPLQEIKLKAGSYLLILKHANAAETRYPVFLARGAKHQNQVRLFTEAQVGAGFAYIPKGLVKVGGTSAPGALLPQEVMVDDFVIGRFPVTFREYCAYLDSQPKNEAFYRLPRYTEEEEEIPLAFRNEAGRFVPVYKNIIKESGRLFCWPANVGELPVMGISWFDAVAYCRWRSNQEGVTYQLPTEHQWEKAARGVDHRIFPWGNFFDPTFCKMKLSRPGNAQPETIGSFPIDESPYLVRDMAGGVSEFVADVVGEVETVVAQGLQESAEDVNTDGTRVVRGGAWSSAEPNCFSTSRQVVSAKIRSSSIGFRVVKVV
jgi:serine/threonine protein kinase/formylglycine-generating enzyme required for sulfatase activity